MLDKAVVVAAIAIFSVYYFNSRSTGTDEPVLEGDDLLAALRKVSVPENLANYVEKSMHNEQIIQVSFFLLMIIHIIIAYQNDTKCISVKSLTVYFSRLIGDQECVGGCGILCW